MDFVTFFALAVPLVVVAIMVIAHPSPVYSALFLVLTLFLLAVYFLFLNAHMVAALQIIVYAGAIMVLFLFVIMLLNLQSDTLRTQRHGLGRAAIIGGVILLAELGPCCCNAPRPSRLRAACPRTSGRSKPWAVSSSPRICCPLKSPASSC